MSREVAARPLGVQIDRVTRLRAALLAVAVFSVAVLTAAGLAQAQNDVPDCVEVQAIARWAAAGYNHIVRIDNGCESRIRCQVATNVNPEPTTVEVAAGQTTDVLTFRDSPASTFEPRVSCTEL